MRTDHDNPAQLDAILDEALGAVRLGRRVDLEEYCRRHPGLADDLRVMLPALTILEASRPGSVESPATPPAALERLPPDFADFHIVGEIGRGAMGIVYEAIQAPLARRVALKVLFRGDKSGGPESLRFQREARIAAGLHHTNIVPVFEAGEFAGNNFYAMQLIEGANLQQLIYRGDVAASAGPAAQPEKEAAGLAETALPSGSTEKNGAGAVSGSSLRPIPSALELSPRVCARIALQVADGLEFAHSRGVLHRDIKPSNIMLDQDGRAWITDFGLARSDDGEGLTATGDVVGTVRYLAPERFRGQVDCRSDIYALGLTLFEALEGQPAFPESDRPRLIARILEGAAPRFTERVPADLAIVCFKCLQHDPDDRYATAGLLAEDLRRFLDGRPVAARPLSRTTVALRWCARNRLITALTALVLIVVATGLVTNWRHFRQLRRVTDESKASSRLAETSQLELLGTVDRFCRTVSEDRRVFRTEYRDLRELLLDSANRLRTEAAGQAAASPAARMQLARILQRLGKMRTSDDQLTDSEDFLIQALQLFAELSRETPDDQELAIELAATHRLLGKVYVQMGKSESAEGQLQESIRGLEQALDRQNASSGSRLAARAELACTHSVRGDLLFNQRQLDAAEVAMNEAIRIWEDLLAAHPENPDAVLELASQQTRLGMMLTSNMKKWRLAGVSFEEANRLYGVLRQLAPDQAESDFGYALMLTKKSLWLYMSGQREKAIAAQQLAITVFERQLQLFQLDRAVQLELGIALRQLGAYLTVADRHDPAALTALERSERLLATAYAADRGDRTAALTLAKTHLGLADARQRLGDPALALEQVDLAIQLLDQALTGEMEDSRAREDRYFAAVSRAKLLTSVGRNDEALLEWDAALKYAPEPFVEIVRMDRTATIASSGQHREATGQAEAILASQPAGADRNRHLLAGAASAFAIAARAALHEGESQGARSESEHYAERAVELLRELQESGGDLAPVLLEREELQFLAERADFQALQRPDGRN